MNFNSETSTEVDDEESKINRGGHLELVHQDDQDIRDRTNLVEYKQSTKKALLEFRCRLEDAIMGNHLFGKYDGRIMASREDLCRATLWGVPLLPTKGHEGTDCILLNFLKARDFKVAEAFEMLRRTMIWRRELQIEGILDEKISQRLENMTQIGKDKEGRHLCYTVYAGFKDRQVYKKPLGMEQRRKEFLRWRIQSMEKCIKDIRFNPAEVNSIVVITDLKNLSGPALKEFHSFSKRALKMFQNFYPGLIHRHIFINVPLWYYAIRAVLSRSPGHKSKFILARPTNITETLLKYITPENIPSQYGGLYREKDDNFSPYDNPSSVNVRAGLMRNIKIPVDEGGVTVVWDIVTIGGEVTYSEEFIPDDEGSYRVQLQKEKRMGESVRNSFYISEPGKIVISIVNATFKTKKVFYRFKMKPTVPVYILNAPQVKSCIK